MGCSLRYKESQDTKILSHMKSKIPPNPVFPLCWMLMDEWQKLIQTKNLQMWPDWLGTHLKHSISEALLVQSASNAQGGPGDVAQLVEYLESSIPRTTKLSTVARAHNPSTWEVGGRRTRSSGSCLATWTAKGQPKFKKIFPWQVLRKGVSLQDAGGILSLD